MKGSRHGLRFQLLLVAKLFVLCIAAAIYLINHRGWVESFMKETYSPPPASLQPVIDAVRINRPIEESYQTIPDSDRTRLFDYWMATEPIQTKLPGQLLKLDPGLFLSRAERTLISGSREQRSRALKFFRLGNQPTAIPILEKARGWAKRRKLNELVLEIDSVVDHLKQPFNQGAAL